VKVTTVGYSKVLDASFVAAVEAAGIDTGGLTPKDIAGLLSEESAATLRGRVLADPALIGQTIEFTALAGGRIDGYYKGRVTMGSATLDSNVKPEQLMLADALRERGILTQSFNMGFLTMPDASDKRPEAAGL